jgi:DMSO/TMAO reductase YedYZ molybdopterin-dependent catalytic subunit
MKRKSIGSLIALLLVVGLAGCGGAPKVDWELKITGAVSTPLTLSYSELVGMEQTDLNDILMEKSLGEDVMTSWSGVPLETILNQAGAGDYSSITALAADGYAIEISKDEAQGATVALKSNGEWIVNVAEEEGKGPIRLVCPETPANRWVFQLQELQVNE